jgi:hypothetical protein
MFTLQTQTAIYVVQNKLLRKRRFLQEPHGVTSQKTPFFIVTAVKTTNLTSCCVCGRNECSEEYYVGHGVDQMYFYFSMVSFLSQNGS